MLVVNLFGGPGAGKSTCASYVFAELKFLNISCELITEFAKDLTWDTSNGIKDQLYVLGNQWHRIYRAYNNVDVVIVDSPIILSIVYNYWNNSIKSTLFEDFIIYLLNQYRNINFFIERDKPYWIVGRNETENDAKKIDEQIKKVLTTNAISYTVIPGRKENYSFVVKSILKEIENE